jgi:hypothetical protein
MAVGKISHIKQISTAAEVNKFDAIICAKTKGEEREADSLHARLGMRMH